MFYYDLPELEDYKIGHENNVYGSIFQKAMEVWPEIDLALLLFNNQFSKNIVVLNKKKIYLSANISSDEFLRETIP